MILRHTVALGLLAALSLASCSRPATDLVTFPLRGQVADVDSTARRLTVAHEAIPNYMPAMTMPFKVKDPVLLRGLAPGDSIGATLVVSRTESWLEDVHLLKKGELVEPLSPEDVRLRRFYREGEQIPDPVWLTQDSTLMRISNFRGRAVALTFIYTRCPLPDFCIRMSQQFAQIASRLSAEQALAGKWQLLSVSFDPRFDRPSVLRQYALAYGADFHAWQFLTDPDTAGTSIGTFADGFGLTYAPAEGMIDHNLRTVVLDKEGRLVKVVEGNEWEADEIVRLLSREAAK